LPSGFCPQISGEDPCPLISRFSTTFSVVPHRDCLRTGLKVAPIRKHLFFPPGDGLQYVRPSSPNRSGAFSLTICVPALPAWSPCLYPSDTPRTLTGSPRAPCGSASSPSWIEQTAVFMFSPNSSFGRRPFLPPFLINLLDLPPSGKFYYEGQPPRTTIVADEIPLATSPVRFPVRF